MACIPALVERRDYEVGCLVVVVGVELVEVEPVFGGKALMKRAMTNTLTSVSATIMLRLVIVGLFVRACNWVAKGNWTGRASLIAL